MPGYNPGAARDYPLHLLSGLLFGVRRLSVHVYDAGASEVSPAES